MCYSSRDYRNRKICLFLLLLLLRFLLFRLTSILPSFYFKRLVRTEFFESQTTMIFTQFAVNAFVIIALSSPSWGRAVSTQEPERARIYSSKEEASSVLEDGRDSLDPDSDPLAGMNDGSDVRKLSKKGSKNMPAPIPPVPDTSTEDDEDDPVSVTLRNHFLVLFPN